MPKGDANSGAVALNKRRKSESFRKIKKSSANCFCLCTVAFAVA